MPEEYDKLPPLANLSASMAAKLANDRRKARSNDLPLRRPTARSDPVDDIIASLGKVDISREGPGAERSEKVTDGVIEGTKSELVEVV